MTNNIPTPIFEQFTKESVASTLRLKIVDDELVDTMNAIANKDELRDSFRDNFITYTSVLAEGNYSPEQYVSAVEFVSYRLMGQSVQLAWEKTFPQRHRRLLSKGATNKHINSHASAYNRTKLVSSITKQSLIPSYIVNNAYFQEALDTQVRIMRDDDVSPKVRVDAAAKVLEYTAMPDSVITNKDEVQEKSMDIIAALAKSVNALAETKRGRIIEGSSTAKEIAGMNIFQAEEAELVDE